MLLRIGTIEAKMLGAEHLAEAVHGHFHRHSTPLLEHITDLVDDLHSRVDGLEDAEVPRRARQQPAPSIAEHRQRRARGTLPP